MKAKEKSFSENLARLEEIVSELENPNLDLEVSLKLLEEGVKIHNLCKAKLSQTNKKMSVILKEADGEQKN